MQLLAGGLVQQFLGADEVLDEADGLAVAEDREVWDDGEVFVRRPVVVKDEVVSGNGPADAADQLLDDRDVRAGILQVEGDAVTVPLGGNLPHVARADVDEVLRLVEPAILALENAHIPAHVVLVQDAVVAGQELVAPEAIAHTLDGVVAIGVCAAVAVLEDVGVGLGVQDGDVLGRQPLGDVHITPAVRVVLLGVGVDHDVFGVEVRDANLALQRVGEVESRVKESAAADTAVGEELGAHPL